MRTTPILEQVRAKRMAHPVMCEKIKKINKQARNSGKKKFDRT
jgi:hypothetical protein